MNETRTVSARELHDWLISDDEIALIDVREQGSFGEGHLLSASNLPLAELEVRARPLMPRLSTPVVVCDKLDGSAEQASERLRAGGYEDVRILQGGVDAWREAGYELFSGINVPSKAFGEFVEHHYQTPRLEASEVKRRIDAGENLIILDSRPFEEFHVMSIPGGIDTPGAELVYRISDLAPDADTTVIVNCAGRTRSIIGCQSLRNAGIPQQVFALKDGTMGWHLAGLDLERGADTRFPEVSEKGLRNGQVMARQVTDRFGVRSISSAGLDQWRDEASHSTLYVLDVRQPEEYQRGHLPDALNAPGGQLVQATDQFVAVRDARIVLVDDTRVRAAMTASWLLQMGFEQVRVLDSGLTGETLEHGDGTREALLPLPDVAGMSPSALAAASQDQVVVVDIRRSLLYRGAHIPGAVWGGRATASSWVARLPAERRCVVVADDDRLARYFCAEFAMLTGREACYLEGGLSGWKSAGFDLAAGSDDALVPPTDVFHRPYDRESGQEAAMQAYLDWEVALVDQVQLDATVRFKAFD